MLVDRKSRQVIPLVPWRLIFKNIWKISKDYCEISGPLKQLLLPSWEANNPVNMLGKRGGEYYSSLSPLRQCCRQQCSLAPCPSCCLSHLHQHWHLWGDVDVIQIQSNLAKQASSLHPAGSLLRLILWPCESWCQQQPEAGDMQQGQAGWLLVASCWLWMRDSAMFCWYYPSADMCAGSHRCLGQPGWPDRSYSHFHVALPAAPGQSHHAPGYGWQQQAGMDLPPLPLPNHTPA